MFDSITHWFDSLQQQSRLFDHADDEVLHSALASLLYHVISADHHLDARKKREFTRILQAEFAVNDEQAEHLYQAAKGSASDIQSDLHTINFYLKRNPAVRMTFLRKLMQLIDVDGVQPPQLDIFYATLHEVFPEVRELGSEEDL